MLAAPRKPRGAVIVKVVLRRGVIEQVGVPLDLYNCLRNTFVACFVGSPRMNLVEGAIAAVDAGSVSFAAPWTATGIEQLARPH